MNVAERVYSMNWSKVDEAMQQAAAPLNPEVAQKKRFVFPGAVLLVGQGGEIVYENSVGCRSLVPDLTPLSAEMVFDVASLTKVMVTVTALMQFVDQGKVEIDRKLSRVFQTFGTHGKEQMTIRHLLTHSSGYPATVTYYKQVARADHRGKAGVMTSRGAVEMIYNEIFRARLDNLPGRVAKYSDIGFILLGHALEVISGGQSLDKLAVEKVIKPLQLKSTGYIDLTKVKRRGVVPLTNIIVPTSDCAWRGRILCGEVQDENAWAMGGVAAHAGIFTTAQDVFRFADELIDCYHGRGKLVSKDVLRQFWTLDGRVPGSTWALGWDTPSPQHSSSGKYFSSKAIGHLGFTGCSLWIDPERELVVVLLSNRVHPTVENNLIREFRPMIHDLVMEALGYAR